MAASTLRKPSRTAREAVLADIRAAYPRGITTNDLIASHGPAVKTRIGELRADGWEVNTTEADGVAYYTLASTTRGAPTRVLAGCIIREDTKVGWTARTHQDAAGGPYPAELLARAESAALAAYRAVLVGAGVQGMHTPVEEDADLDLGFAWEPKALPPEADGWDGSYGDEGVGDDEEEVEDDE